MSLEFWFRNKEINILISYSNLSNRDPCNKITKWVGCARKNKLRPSNGVGKRKKEYRSKTLSPCINVSLGILPTSNLLNQICHQRNRRENVAKTINNGSEINIAAGSIWKYNAPWLSGQNLELVKLHTQGDQLGARTPETEMWGFPAKKWALWRNLKCVFSG